ncbi:MAG: hypothetical protein ACI8QD_000961 [Cyclobacteriaceae bacterium]|jgi:hypothetical protein
MNWGQSIALVFTAFAALMIYMVVTSFQANVDLVTEDYYMEELNFQQRIDKTNNVESEQKEVRHQLMTSGLELTFPEVSDQAKVTGQIQIYRPSLATMDREVPVTIDLNRQQNIAPSMLSPGKYIIKIDWTDGYLLYYQEIELMIPGV